MTGTQSQPVELRSLQRQLVERLDAFRRRLRGRLVFEGATRVLAEAVVLGVLSLVVDWWLRLGLGMRLFLLAAGLAALAMEAWRHLLVPMCLRLGPVALAAVLDRKSRSNGANGNGNGHRHALLAPRVASVLELPRLVNNRTVTSESMVRTAVLRSHEALAAVDLDQYLDARRLKRTRAAAVALALVPLVLTIVAPATMALWVRRWFFGSNQPWPQRTHLAVAGLDNGRIIVPRGEPAVLRVSLRDGSADPGAVRLRLRPQRGGKTDATLTRFGAGDYRYDLPPLQAPARLEISGGDDELEPITIDPVDRPRVVSFQLASRHPRQKEPEVQSFSGQASDNAFLPKTELELRWAANVPVAEARVRGPKEGPGQADLRRVSDKDFSLKWVHDRPVQFEVELVGAVGGLTSLPTPISIGMKVDQPPRVTLQYSGVRQRVTPMARIPMVVHSRDDYGLARVELVTKAEMAPSEEEKSATTQAAAPATKPAGPAEWTLALMGPVDPATELEVRKPHEVQLASIGLAPGALLSLTGKAADACYTGVQTAQSRTVTFRVVRPEELFREILLRQQAERAKFRKALNEAEGIRDVLATVTSREAAVAAAQRHRLVQRESKRIATSLAESLTEMKLNALGGQEAFDMMQNTILGPLDALDKELMDPQRQALDKLGDASDAARVGEATGRQEQIVEKMKEILKQMNQWDSFVDVLNQLNEIIRIQEGVRKTTEQIKDKETEGLFKD
jgi:hypothetical protein